MTALCGAIVSSTAVTAAFARRLRTDREAEGALIAGIALASVVMFVRVLLLAVASRWAVQRFGDAGIAVLLSLTGLADVDAAVITLAGLPVDILDGRTAGLVLASPVLVNTAFKGVLAARYCSGQDRLARGHAALRQRAGRRSRFGCFHLRGACQLHIHSAST